MKLLSRILPILFAAQGVSHSALVAGWNMNETTGTIADSSGNNLTGTPTPYALAHNGLAYGQSSVAVGNYGAITVTPKDAAKFGTSIQFIRDGSGMFQIGNPAVIGDLAGSGPTGTFTVMAWVNANVVASSNQRIFATGPSNGWGAGLSNVDQVLFTTFGVADQRSNTAPSANNVWQHVAYVWNAGTLEVFINGVSKFTSSSGYNDETNAQFGIGGNGNGGDHFNGRMDELKVFNSALSQSEIVAAALPPAEVGPLLFVASSVSSNNNGAPQVISIPFSNESETATLTLSSVTPGGADAGFFTVNHFTTSVAPGASGSVEVSFTPSGSRLYQTGLVITSNDGVSPTRMTTLNVNVLDPVIKASATRLDFGALAANPGLQTRTLTLTNEGGATALEIYGPSFLGQGGNGFSVVSYPASIAPGASGDVVISFNPGSATGDFSDLLSIVTNATNTSELILPVVAKVASVAGVKPVYVVNGDFNMGGWESAIGTSPAGWTTSLAAVNSPGFYGQGGAMTPGLTSIAAHLQSYAGYCEQNLSTANSGLTAGKVNAITVAFDRVYRNDAATNGPAMLRVSLWDKTNDIEIAGRDLVFEDPGVQAGNTLMPVVLRLPYDSSTYSGEEIALRIARVSPLLVANMYYATLIIDNVSVAVDGQWMPTDGYPAWILANGLDGSPGKENGLADDPDKDGISNFDEFAFGGNPLSSASGVLSAGSSSDTTGDMQPEWILTIAVRADALFSGGPAPAGSGNGVNYAIEGSVDLLGFLAAVEGPLAAPVVPATLPVQPPAGYKYVSFRLAGSNGLSGKGFLRAKATTP